MLAKKPLTDVAIRKLKAPIAGKRDLRWDALVPGLAVRVTDKGTKSLVLVVRYPGDRHPAPRTLGEYGAITLEAARDKARTWLALIAQGIDPRQQEAEQVKKREDEAAKKAAEQANTFCAAFEQFVARHLSKLRTGKDVEREMRRLLMPTWGPRPLTSITRKDVKTVINSLADGGKPIMANRLLAYIKTFYKWANDRDLIEGTPAVLVNRPGAECHGTRVLDDDELRAVWRVASSKIGYPFGPLYLMLLLTGLRLGEVAGAPWSEFDLQRKLWTIPAERMKGKRIHLVPLTDEAIEILSSLPRFATGGRRGDDYLFSTTDGEKPVSGFSKAKARLDRKMVRTWRALGRLGGDDRRGETFDDWTLHDIRRTVRTHLSALPVPEGDLVRELVIAHAKPGLHKVYDQFAYLDEKRKALELWTARLKGILER